MTKKIKVLYGLILISFFSCQEDSAELPTLTTSTVVNITSTLATSGGIIVTDGGAPVTQRGIAWSTSPNPTIKNNSTNDGSGTGSFTSNLTGLTANTSYYVRAYAINSAGTVYGNQQSFTTSNSVSSGIVSNPGAGVIFNGYSYESVILGNGQEWMAENLRTNSYANGDPIPNVTTPNQWDNITTGAWAHYNNDSQYESPYGKLYNWYVVADPRNVCPSGWHVPTDAEWSTFINYLDPNANGGYSPNSAGGKMKSSGTQYWESPNTAATNQSGFSGLPGGALYSNLGGFYKMDTIGEWWSSTEYNGFPMPCGVTRSLGYNFGFVDGGAIIKKCGFSVRCIRD